MDDTPGTSGLRVKQIAAAAGCFLLVALAILTYPFSLVVGLYAIPVLVLVGIVIVLLRGRRRR